MKGRRTQEARREVFRVGVGDGPDYWRVLLEVEKGNETCQRENEREETGSRPCPGSGYLVGARKRKIRE